MRTVVCVLLAVAVAVTGAPNGYRPKGALLPYNYHPVIEHVIGNQIAGSSEEDDYRNDPNYVPDYDDDYDVSEEYDDATYEYSDESPYSVEDSNLWDSDEDPDWRPSQESQETQETQDDHRYVPNYDEDYDVSEEYDDGTYEHSDEAPYSVEESEEAKLWLSDEDPDWRPPYDSQETQETQSQENQSQETQEIQSQETQSQETQEIQSQESQETGVGPILQQIAQILSTGASFLPEELQGQGAQAVSHGEVEEMLRAMDLTEEDARLVLHNLQKLRQDLHSSQVPPAPSDRPFPPVGAPFPPVGPPLPPVGVYKRSLRYTAGVKQLQQDETAIDSGNQRWVGEGVEPESGGGGWFDFGSSSQSEEDEDKPSFTGWLQRGWRRVSDAAEDLGDRAESTFRHLGHSIAGAAHTVHDSARTAYHQLQERVPQVVERLKALFVKFGTVVQEGARYCLRRLTHAYDTKVRGAEIMVKLEQKLEEGHAEVAKFFQVLGDKIAAWREQHPAEGVDTGLVLEHHHQGAGEGQSQSQQEGQQRQSAEGTMPDFFQDQEVEDELSRLVEIGILTDDEKQFIIQSQQNEQQSQGYQQQNQNYQQQNQDYQQQNQDYQQQNQHSQDYQQQNQNYQRQNQNYQQQNQNYQQQNEPLPDWSYIR